MLKFSTTANVGDVIKAYDFKPMTDRPDMFMTGIVTAKGPIYQKIPGTDREIYVCDGYTVKIIGADNVTKTRRIGDVGYIPFEVDMMEYDTRIELVATADELREVMAA